jgi:transposase
VDSVYLPPSKKNAQIEGAIVVHQDEASFRQTPTLYQTWARKNSQPKVSTKGARNTQKIFGAVAPQTAQFIYHHTDQSFNHKTYIEFLEDHLLPSYYRKSHRVYLIQDNASYHKKPETYEWFESNRKYIEVFNLPPYSPELNAEERIWHHTRMCATHNRYFETKEELCDALFAAFEQMQRNPGSIQGYLQPFC